MFDLNRYPKNYDSAIEMLESILHCVELSALYYIYIGINLILIINDCTINAIKYFFELF